MYESEAGRLLRLAVDRLHHHARKDAPDIVDYSLCVRAFKIIEGGGSREVVYQTPPNPSDPVVVTDGAGIYSRVIDGDFESTPGVVGFGGVVGGVQRLRVVTFAWGPRELCGAGGELAMFQRLANRLNAQILPLETIPPPPLVEVWTTESRVRRAVYDAPDAFRAEFSRDSDLPPLSFCLRVEWELALGLSAIFCEDQTFCDQIAPSTPGHPGHP